MKLRTLIIFPAVIGTLILTGCSNESAKQVNLNLRYITADSAPVQANDINAQAQIAEASTSIGHSLQTLSAIQIAKNPSVKIQDPVNAGGLSRQASLNWYGPVEPAVRKIANAANYKLVILGSAPSIPVIVTINAKNQPLATILRNLTFQAAPTVTITVHPSTRVVELRYNKK